MRLYRATRNCGYDEPCEAIVEANTKQEVLDLLTVTWSSGLTLVKPSDWTIEAIRPRTRKPRILLVQTLDG